MLRTSLSSPSAARTVLPTASPLRVNRPTGLRKGFDLDGPTVIAESSAFLLLLMVTVAVVYFLPPAAGLAYFAIIMAVFFRTSKDYFWLAFFVVLAAKPGNLFHSFGEAHDFGKVGIELPVIPLTSEITISILEIFVALALVKALVKGLRYRYLLARPLWVLAGYLVVLLIVSLAAFETSTIRFLKDLRNVFYLSAFVSIPNLLVTRRDVYSFIFTLFPVVLLVLAIQLYFFVTGDHFVNTFIPDLITAEARMGEGMRYLSFGTEVLVLLLCFTLALVLLSVRRGREPVSVYLYAVALFGFLGIFLTGTRVWFVVLGIIGVAALIALKLNVRVMIGALLTAAVVVLSLTNVPQVETGLENAWARISTLGGLGKPGNEATVQVQTKIDQRLPSVLEGFRQSPLFGHGLSDDVHEYKDVDVGNFSLLAEVGVLGFLAFCYLWVSYFLMIQYSFRATTRANPYRGAVMILAAAMLGLLAAHFTTKALYGYLVGGGAVLFHAFFLFLSEFFVLESVRAERLARTRPVRIRP